MIDLKERYFLASFNFNKDKPEDFELKPVNGEDFYLDMNGIRWTEESMWSNGWGDEYGFVRIPQLNADELWFLLLESSIGENKRGAAEYLNRLFPSELKSKLKHLFKSRKKLNRKLTKRLLNLEVLQTGMNIDEVIGKGNNEVTKDHEEWKSLKHNFEMLRTESIWKRIMKL